MTVTTIKSESQFKEIIASPDAAAIYFTAPWDQPAQALKPKFASLADKFTGLKFYAVDICDQQDVAMDAHVEASRVFFYKGGAKVDEWVGSSDSALERSVAAHAH